MDNLFDLPLTLPTRGPVPKTPDLRIESALLEAGYALVAGVDEAGRGCLAGPVVAAAVILPAGVRLPGVGDSKQLTAEVREHLAPVIKRECAAFGVGVCTATEIDRWNILHASLEAMRRALLALDVTPDFTLVDGNKLIQRLACPQQAVVKGDARSLTIAAASIIAKTTRDERMRELDARYPGYGWSENMGYPTTDHFEGLSRLGPSPVHRRSFRLRLSEPAQQNLFGA